MNQSITAPDGLSAAEVIERARAAREQVRQGEIAELEMVLAWAHLHPCGVGESPAGWGEVDLHGEGVLTLAGPGAPLVSEFAPAELAAALGLRLDQGRQLVGDVLELAHRLPRLWDHTRAGRVPVWRARGISQETRDLSFEAAAYADRLISATPTRVSSVRASQLVDEARLYFDPDRAVEDERAALEARGVWRRRGRAAATTEVSMLLDTADALAFECVIADLAHELGRHGDPRSLDVRRAHAVGILADPQHALDLLHGLTADPATAAVRTTRGTGSAMLYLHVDADHLVTGVGGVVEKLGPATLDLLQQWLARCTAAGGKVVVRPVLDLAGCDNAGAVDQHDPPEWMRELVVLRDATCVFPGCTRDSRGCDLDHVTAYLDPDHGGPPGQTRPDNLAPLCRTHHRIKTHTAWTYKRLDDGTCTWTSPTGHQHDVPPRPRHPR